MRFAPSATDPEGQPLVWSAVGLPPGVGIDATTGELTGAPTSARDFVATLQVTDPEALVGDATVSWQVTAAGLATTPLVLNEYNAVTPTAQLGDGAGSDVVFGSLGGNGGDWLELVVVDDADLRGVQLQLWDRDRANDGFAMTDTLVFADVPLLADVPRGTIITIAEDRAEDLSFDPANDDWHIEANVSNAAQSLLFTQASQSNFDTNRHSFHLLVLAADGTPLGSFQGETDAWRATQGNVAGNEVFAVCVTPAAAPMPLDAARDIATTSTFGDVNDCDGTLQSFATVRGRDANCSGDHSIVDALVVAQYTVELRSDYPSCPLQNPATEISAAAGDTNGDGATNILDALLIAQCTVGIDNGFCDSD